MMAKEEYSNVLRRAWLICHLARLLPVDEMIQAHEHATTIGPLLDPTAFIHADHDKVRQDRDMLGAVSKLVQTIEEIAARYGIDDKLTEIEAVHAAITLQHLTVQAAVDQTDTPAPDKGANP